MTKEELENKIATFTGGRAAEELIFHSITTGASNDIEQATKIARAMVTRYGMTDEFDDGGNGNRDQPVSWRRYVSFPVPQNTQKEIDEKVVQLVGSNQILGPLGDLPLLGGEQLWRDGSVQDIPQNGGQFGVGGLHRICGVGH